MVDIVLNHVTESKIPECEEQQGEDIAKDAEGGDDEDGDAIDVELQLQVQLGDGHLDLSLLLLTLTLVNLDQTC